MENKRISPAFWGKNGLKIPKPQTFKQRMQRVLGAVLSAPCWVDLLADTNFLPFLDKKRSFWDKKYFCLEKKRAFLESKRISPAFGGEMGLESLNRKPSGRGCSGCWGLC